MLSTFDCTVLRNYFELLFEYNPKDISRIVIFVLGLSRLQLMHSLFFVSGRRLAEAFYDVKCDPGFRCISKAEPKSSHPLPFLRWILKILHDITGRLQDVLMLS